MSAWFSVAVAQAAVFDLSLTPDQQNKLGTGDANAAVGIFINHIGDILIKIALPLALMGVLYAAFKLVNGNGNAKAYEAAKNSLIWVVVGAFFVIGSAWIVRLVYGFFSLN